MKTTLDREGQFYRGNLHCHTTCSDGDYTPEESVEIYKKAGYDFLAITDHNRWGARLDLASEDFLILPGTEIDTVYEGGVHHIVGIGKACTLPDKAVIPQEFRRNVHPQAMIDYLRDAGCLAIYAHPFWSYCDQALLSSLDGLTGMEIINYSCEQEWKSGISEPYFEFLWRDGRTPWCFGADDAHGHVPDYLGGSITVKAPELTAPEILAAIERGSFYASYTPQGSIKPELLDFYVEDGIAYVKSSPCRNIYLIVSRTKYHPAHGTADAPLTAHSWKLPEDAVRVKCVLTGFDGAITWSQPIIL
ncbi:MAG: CehA/McbA family metallohydrolase [Clostridia bacterium]|nr:CehA/McbA family metallohydrolase [Clostridia bacterium]